MVGVGSSDFSRMKFRLFIYADHSGCFYSQWRWASTFGEWFNASSSGGTLFTLIAMGTKSVVGDDLRTL